MTDQQIDQRRAMLLALWLLAGGWQPRASVMQLRRRARYAGWRMTRGGRPIKLARRHELVELLEHSGPHQGRRAG